MIKLLHLCTTFRTVFLSTRFLLLIQQFSQNKVLLPHLRSHHLFRISTFSFGTEFFTPGGELQLPRRLGEATSFLWSEKLGLAEERRAAERTRRLLDALKAEEEEEDEMSRREREDLWEDCMAIGDAYSVPGDLIREVPWLEGEVAVLKDTLREREEAREEMATALLDDLGGEAAALVAEAAAEAAGEAAVVDALVLSLEELGRELRREEEGWGEDVDDEMQRLNFECNMILNGAAEDRGDGDEVWDEALLETRWKDMLAREEEFERDFAEMEQDMVELGVHLAAVDGEDGEESGFVPSSLAWTASARSILRRSRSVRRMLESYRARASYWRSKSGVGEIITSGENRNHDDGNDDSVGAGQEEEDEYEMIALKNAVAERTTQWNRELEQWK